MAYSKFPLLKKKKSESITLENYKSEFNSENFLKSHIPGAGLKSILNSNNSANGKNDLKELVKKMKFARNGGLPILLALSPDIISNGLSTLIIDLMQRGWISAISINEEFLIRDFEIALSGKFIDYKNNFMNNNEITGIAEETGLFLNIAFKEGDKKEKGAGEAVGEYLSSSKFNFNEFSILANGYKLNIPIVLHSLPGASKLHYHSNFEGKIFGNLLDRDFILYSSIISNIGQNGVYFATNIDRNGLDILINALEFCFESGSLLKSVSIGITGDIEDNSVRSDIEKLADSENISIYRIKGNPDLLLPIFASLLLEEV